MSYCQLVKTLNTMPFHTRVCAGDEEFPEEVEKLSKQNQKRI